MPTQTVAIGKPDPQEYLAYYGRYIALVSTDNVVSYLHQQERDLSASFAKITEQQSEFRYAPGKWSVKEVLGHVNDAERVFAYRALRISRNDKTPIEGFEQDDYVRDGPFRHVSWADLVAEFRTIRSATLSLFSSLNEAESRRRGIANKANISVRAIAWIIAGHALHHQQVLQNAYQLPKPQNT
jgi:DinB superfamily